jgi:tRNA A-37 threonylcarbamoyl transferase component Bud32
MTEPGDFAGRLAEIEAGISANAEPARLDEQLERLSAEVPSDPAIRLRYLLARATVFNRDGAFQRALEFLFEARRIAAAEAHLAAWRPRISRLLATVNAWRGRQGAAANELLRAYAEAAALDDPVETALILAESGRASKEAGLFDNALVQLEQALALPHLPKRERARTVVNRLQVLNALGRPADVLDDAARSAEAVEAETDRLRLLVRLERTRALAATGDFAAARLLLEEARGFAGENDNGWSRIELADATADVDFRELGNDPAKVKARIAEMKRSAEHRLESKQRQRLHFSEGLARVQYSELLRLSGEVREAAEEASEALRIGYREQHSTLIEHAKGALLACGDALADSHDAPLVDSRYLPCELIGQGGYGEVRRAYDLRSGEVRALKTIDLGKVTDPERRRNLVRDARAELERAKRIRHPGLVGIHGVFVDASKIVIVQGFVEGRSLRRRLKEPFDRNRLLALFVQIAHALWELHEAGIAHRDLKPENVMVDRRERAIVVDFGLAVLAGVDSELGLPRGTLGYAAPELHARPQGEQANRLLDVYALGKMLQEAFGVTAKSGLLGSFGASAFERLVRQMTAEAPGDRPQSMQEIAASLEAELRAAAPDGFS